MSQDLLARGQGLRMDKEKVIKQMKRETPHGMLEEDLKKMGWAIGDLKTNQYDFPDQIMLEITSTRIYILRDVFEKRLKEVKKNG